MVLQTIVEMLTTPSNEGIGCIAWSIVSFDIEEVGNVAVSLDNVVLSWMHTVVLLERKLRMDCD